MRVLILGGSQFLGRAIAAHACAAGHDVTCAARGLAGPIAAGAWLRVSNGPVVGLTSDEEKTVLAAWHAEKAAQSMRL